MPVRIKTAQILQVKQAILTKRQSGKCALCDRAITMSEACLDHDHATGLIRGVLCRNCNGIEGKIRNLVTRARRDMSHDLYLAKVILYWQHYSTDRTGLLHPTHRSEDEQRLRRNAKARKARVKKKKAGT